MLGNPPPSEDPLLRALEIYPGVTDELLRALIEQVRLNSADLREHNRWWNQMGIRGLSDNEREAFAPLLRIGAARRDQEPVRRLNETRFIAYIGIIVGAMTFISQLIITYLPHPH